MPGSQQDGVGPPPGHDERLFGVGGVESWSRRRPTVPYVWACSITVPVAAIERSP